MSRKPRFKLQRRNSGDAGDRALHGNKRWINIASLPDGTKGWLLTFEEATKLYWNLAEGYPTGTYRIMEKR